MTAPEQQAADPRKPAWDAVFAYIRTLPREDARLILVERNAMIWRGVNAALVALGYPGEYEQAVPEQQAAPGQADLHQRLADALHDVLHTARSGTFTGLVAIEQTDAVLATLQPELAELAALREQLAAAQAEIARLRATTPSAPSA